VFTIFLIIGGFIGYSAPYIANFLSVAMYDRSSLDAIMHEFLAGIYLPDAITDDVMLVAYDYNSQQPRFYSKYFYAEDSLIYGVEVYEATGASSAAPTYFDPKFLVSGYGNEEVQIDGGVICNNPSLYAYQMAKYLHGNE
jgi:patatin-like phospholipase/acyl hydrolase